MSERAAARPTPGVATAGEGWRRASGEPAQKRAKKRRASGRRVNSPSAPITDDVPAIPPRKRYSGTSGFFHVAGLTMFRP